jgi:hypothetical protein
MSRYNRKDDWVNDPIGWSRFHWPKMKVYDRQEDILLSVRDNYETVVVAGNMMGKDYIAARAALWFFCSRTPCRVVTTSVDGTQLEGVLWGEIRRAVQEAADNGRPLDAEHGGHLITNHLHYRKLVNGRECGLSYMIGRVARKGEGLLGHHAYPDDWDGVTPHTLFIADEASGVEDISYERADTWAKRKLVIGNPYPCQNFFRKAVRGGDVLVS